MAVPAPRLVAALVELSTRAGARSVRVVDGRTGTVVATAGAGPEPGDATVPGVDDPATVVGLLREAMALGTGGLDDVVVTTDRSVHVLRPATVAGVFVHLRLDVGRADTVRARRALADPAFHDAVRRAVAPVEAVPAAVHPASGPPRSASALTFGPARVAADHDPGAHGGSGVGPPAVRPPAPAFAPVPAPPVVAVPVVVTAPAPAPAPSDVPVSPDVPGPPGATPSSTTTTMSTAPSLFGAAVSPAAVSPAAAVPSTAVPLPRSADPAPPVPAPRTARPAPQQPALAGLVADRARTGDGARAAVALAELSRPDAPAVVLPRRRSARGVRVVPAPRSGGTTGLPERSWARDLDTLRRLADGLRRLS